MKKLTSPWAWIPTLYFAEGIPYVAVMTISVILYKQMGLGNADITFYTSWLYLPWVIKPLWSPLVDLVKTKMWWILIMQLLIGAALGGVAFTIPTNFWLQGTLFFFWIMAFSSATHDIAADGYYMIALDEHEQSLFVGIRSTFYRLATIIGSGVLVMIAGALQERFGQSIPLSWSLMFYGACALFVALWLWHSAVLPRVKEGATTAVPVGEKQCLEPEAEQKSMLGLIADFFTKFPVKETVIGILFMLLYRMPEGLLAKVSALFLVDNTAVGGLELTAEQYGLVQGTVGVIGLTLGGIIGGICAGVGGLKKWLWPMVCAITLPDAVYIYLSYCQPDNLYIVNACVFVEQFGYGFGFTAYMLYLIYYSRGNYKTSHYALCTAFMALSMMIPGLFAGQLQEAVGYQSFFLIVMACCIVTFIMAALIKIDPEFGKKK